MPKKIKYGTIFCGRTNVFLERTKVKPMADHNKYYVVTEKAVPDVLLKVVEAKETFGDPEAGYRTGGSGCGGDKQKLLL